MWVDGIKLNRTNIENYDWEISWKQTDKVDNLSTFRKIRQLFMLIKAAPQDPLRQPDVTGRRDSRRFQQPSDGRQCHPSTDWYHTESAAEIHAMYLSNQNAFQLLFRPFSLLTFSYCILRKFQRHSWYSYRLIGVFTRRCFKILHVGSLSTTSQIQTQTSTRQQTAENHYN